MDEEYRQHRVDQAHAYLERIRKMGEGCDDLRALVDDARDRMRGVDYSRDAVSISPTDDAMADAVTDIQERIAEYVAALAAYEDERNAANRALMLMEDVTESRALRWRYLLGREWEAVCVELGYSYDGMMKLRRRALCSYWEVMPTAERDPRPHAILDADF